MKGYACVGMSQPKTVENVGAAIRACQAYNAAFMAIMGKRYKRSCLDTGSGFKHLPLFHVNNLREAIPFDCVPVAVDLVEGARDLSTYTHPERAFYIFGPEDGTLGRKTTDWCRDTIYIPTSICMNLAATVNVVLYDRLSKMRRA